MKQATIKAFTLRAMLIAIVLAGMASVVFATPAFATTFEKQWTVEFTGSGMEDHGSAEIAQVVGGMQPGDSAKFTVDLYESYDGAADWYMANEVLKTMEKSFTDANSNSGGSYSYKLTFISPNGEEKVILSNEVVSGDAGTGETKGLFDATEATGEWFFLETLAAGARASVILEVGIDGETHGNTYFDTNAQVELKFSAEPNATNPGVSNTDDPQEEAEDPTNPENPETPDAEAEENSDEEEGKTPLSQTSDDLRLGIIVLVAVIAAVALGVAAWRRRKNQDKKEGDAR